MQYTYQPEGICPKMLAFELEGDVVTDIRFLGGCNGNLQAVATLINGMTVDEIEAKLGHIRCGNKPTSCVNQLCIALRKAQEKSKAEAK